MLQFAISIDIIFCHRKGKHTLVLRSVYYSLLQIKPLQALLSCRHSYPLVFDWLVDIQIYIEVPKVLITFRIRKLFGLCRVQNRFLGEIIVFSELHVTVTDLSSRVSGWEQAGW